MFPKYKEIRLPLLAELSSRGGESRPSDLDSLGRTIYDNLADYFNLSAKARDEIIFEGNGTERSKWENMVRWTRNDLKKEGLLIAPSRGIWKISKEGQLKLKESDIDDSSDRRTFRPHLQIDLNTFLARQKRAEEIGYRGEMHIVEFEKVRLRGLGQATLAERVVHMAQINVAAGYDILSFDESSEEIYIEVKTSIHPRSQFELTRNELETARRYRASYWIYRVISIESKPQILKIQDPWQLIQEGRLLTNPSSYSITFSEYYEPKT